MSNCNRTGCGRRTGSGYRFDGSVTEDRQDLRICGPCIMSIGLDIHSRLHELSHMKWGSPFLLAWTVLQQISTMLVQ